MKDQKTTSPATTTRTQTNGSKNPNNSPKRTQQKTCTPKRFRSCLPLLIFGLGAVSLWQSSREWLKVNPALLKEVWVEMKAQATADIPEEILFQHAETRQNRSQVETPQSKLDPPPTPRYAYVFLVTGCDPSAAPETSNMILVYSVLVSAIVLRDAGSTSDIVLFMRMHPSSSSETLPDKITKMLQETAHVTIRYLPTAKVENFYTSMMQKFFVLTMVEYKRIIFMDNDVMPLCNLDYLFHLSNGTNLPGTIRENFVIPGAYVPANGGVFMMAPNLDDYEWLQKTWDEGITRFNVSYGWGHRIQAPDKWVSLQKYQPEGRLWDFQAARSDQGLLYHYVKYMKKSVTVFRYDFVETYGVEEGEEDFRKAPVKLLRTEKANKLLQGGCLSKNAPLVGRRSPHPPHNDIYHFAGPKNKPWLQKERGSPMLYGGRRVEPRDAAQLWYKVLRNVTRRYGVNVDPFLYKAQTMHNVNLTGMIQDHLIHEKE